MAFNSVLGSLTSRMWSSPISAGATAFGLGAGTFAGAYSFFGTEGSFSDKADAGLSSGIAYGVGGAGLVLAGAYASAFRAGFDRYQGPIHSAVGYGAARNIKDAAGYPASRAASYLSGLGREFRTPGGYKSVLTRPVVSGGIGALLGAYVGSKVSDDSGHSAAVGAVVGAGAGVAAGRLAKASSVWSKWGKSTRAGSILAASVALGGALKLMSAPEYETEDVEQSNDQAPANSGIRDRMSRIGANGDLVFGLHRSR